MHFSHLCLTISHQHNLNLCFGVRLQKNLSIFTYVKRHGDIKEKGHANILSCHHCSIFQDERLQQRLKSNTQTHLNYHRTVNEKAFVGNTLSFFYKSQTQRQQRAHVQQIQNTKRKIKIRFKLRNSKASGCGFWDSH